MNPRPARTRRLYLTVGQRTTGRSLSAGRGATAAAFARRASRLRCLRPGYRNQLVSTEQDLFFPSQNRIENQIAFTREKSRFVHPGGRVEFRLSYLVEVHAHTGLPVLAEVCISKKKKKNPNQSIDSFSQKDRRKISSGMCHSRWLRI